MKIDITKFDSGIGVAIVFALAGLGLFLVAIKLMSNSMRSMSSGFISKMIGTITKNKYRGFLIGVIFTTMIQSSDGAVALVIGLISAGMLKLKKAIPFILGANIGTATTAVIVALGAASAGAFEFVQYLPLLSFIGAGTMIFVKENKKIQVALLIFSVGAIFLGLKVMGAGMKAITSEGWFGSFVNSVGSNPWLALLTNTSLTGIVQSSSATVTVVQNIYAVGHDASNNIILSNMGLDSAIAMVIGANIGTTFTALFASIGGSKEARKVAVIWLTTNFIMAGLVMPFIGYYADFINLIQPVNNNGSYDQINFEMRFQLAWAHLIFNTIMAFIFLWFINQLAWWANKIVPESKTKNSYEFHLSSELLEEDAILAFESTKLATQSLGKMTLDSIVLLRKYIKDPQKDTYKKYQELIKLIDTSRKSLNNYLVEIGTKDIPKKVSNQHMSLILSARSLERVPILGEQFINSLRLALKKNKFIVNESIIKESDNLLAVINSITKRGIKQLTRYSTKRKNEMNLLSNKLQSLVEKYSSNHVKRSSKDNFDYLAEIKILERMGHHALRLQKYTRKGRNEVDTIALDKKLEKELSLNT